MAQDEAGDVERLVADERRQVHGEPELFGRVGLVRLEIAGVGPAPAGRGQVVALAALDLGVVDADEAHGQALAAADVERDLVVVVHPVEPAPDLAAVDGRRPLVGLELAQGGQGREGDGDVGVVLVGRVVGVDDLGPRRPEDLDQVGPEPARADVLDLGARVVELDEDAVVAEDGRLLLLACAGARPWPRR